MIKMIVGLLMMIILFLGGVLFGIDTASEGITNTRGFESSTVETAVNPGKSENGKYEIEVMGQNFQQVDVDQKEQEYQENESSHFTQKLAGGLESSVEWFYNKMIESAYQLVQSFF